MQLDCFEHFFLFSNPQKHTNLKFNIAFNEIVLNYNNCIKKDLTLCLHADVQLNIFKIYILKHTPNMTTWELITILCRNTFRGQYVGGVSLK